MSKSTMFYWETPDGGSNSFIIYGDFEGEVLKHLSDKIFAIHLLNKQANIQMIANSVVDDWNSFFGMGATI